LVLFLERLGVCSQIVPKPDRIAGDTVYGTARLLKWLMDRGIEPHVPVWDKSARPDGKFGRADFTFDKERNVYICPGGTQLTSTGNIDQGRIVYYKAADAECEMNDVGGHSGDVRLWQIVLQKSLKWREII
jgi:hypothetical protein